jgi:hypothetical protein
MEIPLDLQRRLDRRWTAKFFHAKRIASKALSADRLARQKENSRPPASTDDQGFGPRQEAAALPAPPKAIASQIKVIDKTSIARTGLSSDE